MHLIIDADPIVYRSGFAAETVHYNVVAEDAEGNVREAHFEPKDDITAHKHMQAWLHEHKLDLVESTKDIKPEPVSHALMIVKQTIESILKDVGFKGKDQYHLLLSGPGNYRERIATFRPYKGNRDPDHKPFHYQAIRDYLTQQWDAIVVTGHEADDEASILAHGFRKRKLKYIVSSIDKDLHQIPGQHYDYRLKQLVTMDDEESRIVLWRQALAGDTTDNIPGACGIGTVKAQKLVEGWVDAGKSDAELWQGAIATYRTQAIERPGCYYVQDAAEVAALENMRLVYLQREPNELWVPPGSEPEYVEVGLDD
jgi:hypothetical protein